MPQDWRGGEGERQKPPFSSQVVTAGRKLVGKVVKDMEEEKDVEVKDGLRSRFLGVQLCPRS